MSCYDTEQVYIKLEDGDAPDYIIENVEEEGIGAGEVLEIVNINVSGLDHGVNISAKLLIFIF